MNGAGKLDIHTQNHESESSRVKTTVCAIPYWGLKMFATFIDHNIHSHVPTKWVDLEGIMLCKIRKRDNDKYVISLISVD